MGRFTSVQGFADNNSSNRAITYDQAKGTTGGGGKDGNNKNDKLVTEKVVNPYGSTSGAGSGEFHVYRHARAREMARWNALDREAKEQQEELEFRTTLENDRKVMETKASKNRKKRQREKEAKRRKKVMKAAGISTDIQKSPASSKNTDGGGEGNGEEEFAYIPVSQQQRQHQQNDREERRNKIESSVIETSTSSSNGDLVIPNDGSFLEMMKRKLQEDLQKIQQPISTYANQNNKSDKGNEQGSSSGVVEVMVINSKDSVPKDNGEEESDEEGPVVPPKSTV